MSRRLSLDPFALTSSGSVLVNMAHFDGPRRPEQMLALARSQKGRVFVGVELSRAELHEASRRMRDGELEAAAFVIGKRQKRARSAKY